MLPFDGQGRAEILVVGTQAIQEGVLGPVVPDEVVASGCVRLGQGRLNSEVARPIGDRRVVPILAP